jgi:predicted NAD/FAD-binding protein
MTSRRPRIAVVGAGISGLTAAYILEGSTSVTLYEASDRLGGHADTHRVVTPDGHNVAFDSGFITFSRKSYPLLSRLFDELGVESDQTRFSFAVRCDGCGLEYVLGGGIHGWLPRVRPADRKNYLSMLAQIPVFDRRAKKLVQQGFAGDSPSLDEFLSRGRFTEYFVQHYAVPLVSSLWSCAPELASEYPASFVARYLEQHGLLSKYKSNNWRTVRGGSHTYVDRIAQILTDVRVATPVQSVSRTSGSVAVAHSDSQVDEFDAVVMATHADESLRLLLDATQMEREVLGAFTYSRNRITVHTDGSVLSQRPNGRGTWNYRLSSCSAPSGVAQITYHMNKLHGFDATDEYLVTLNDASLVRQCRVIAQIIYEHPIDSMGSVAARHQLPKLTRDRTAFAGSYHGWSSHEDGCRSGVEAASSLGFRW